MRPIEISTVDRKKSKVPTRLSAINSTQVQTIFLAQFFEIFFCTILHCYPQYTIEYTQPW